LHGDDRAEPERDEEIKGGHAQIFRNCRVFALIDEPAAERIPVPA
jgi:hypothetical protein